jgi:hypothetical protein
LPSRRGRARGLGRFRQPEVHQLGSSFRQHDVPGLQIAMHHSTAMGFLQAFANLGGAFQQPLERQAPFAQALAQRLAFHELHHQVAGAVLVAHVVELADVGMVPG